MKKSFCTKLGVSLTLALATAAYAQPANDACSAAIAVGLGSTLVNNTGATPDVAFTCGFNSNLTVWYSYTAGFTGGLTIAMSGPGSLTDPTIAIFDTCGGTQLACDDDAGPGFYSLINNFPVTSGTTYLIAVAGYNGQSGDVTMTLSPPLPPSGNDTCGTSAVIANNSTTPFGISGTEVTDIVPTCGFNGQYDIWYSYTNSTAGAQDATVNTFGSTFDTILTAWDACGGTQLACNDDTGGLQSQIILSIPAGATRYFAVSGYNGATGTGQISIAAASPTPFDSCALAIPVAGQGVTQTFDTTGLTTDGVGCTGGLDGWYAWTPTQSGFGRVTTCGLSGSDTTLAAYSSCGGTLLACNDDACGLQSRIGFGATAGTTYFIRIAGFANQVVTGDVLFEIVPAPANDNCAGATAVGDGTHAFDNTAATQEVQISCAFGGAVNSGTDVWLAYTAPATGTRRFDVTDYFNGDSNLAIFDSCGGTEIACNDDFDTLLSRVEIPVTAGTTYYVRLAGWGNPGGQGAGTLVIGEPPPPPANDNCAGAQAVTLGSSTSFNSESATLDGVAGSCNTGGAPDDKDVWFSFTAGAGDTAVTFDTLGSEYDTTMQILDGCSGTELACNDDFDGTLQSGICNFPVTSGTTYLIRVAAWGTGAVGGNGTLNLSAATGGNPFSPPANAIDEPGACDDAPSADLNTGCNALQFGNPVVYTQLNICDTYKGTASANLPNGFRDTDWYQFTLDAGDTVTVSGQVQFAAFTAILQVNDCATGDIVVVASNFPDPAGCEPTADFTYSATLAAGTYVVFMAPLFGEAAACGSGEQYWFTIEGSTPCSSLVCNDIDFNNDGSFFDPQDIDAFLSVYSEGPCIPGTATCDSIDFNNDTSVFDPCDISSFLTVYAEGPCTACGE